MQTSAMTNDEFDLALFIKMLKMSTAENDGQALVAIRKANALLKRNNLDWEQLLKGKITIVNDPFGSIPTPPTPRAAPPPQPRPAAPPPPPLRPAPPPPQRRARSHAEVSTFLARIQGELSILTNTDLTRFAQIEVEWHRHQALFDVDYAWLQGMAGQVTPRPRSRDQVQQFFDVLDLAPLGMAEGSRLARVRHEWLQRNNHMMNDSDYFWLERLFQRHQPCGARGGKAKRLF